MISKQILPLSSGGTWWPRMINKARHCQWGPVWKGSRLVPCHGRCSRSHTDNPEHVSRESGGGIYISTWHWWLRFLLPASLNVSATAVCVFWQITIGHRTSIYHASQRHISKKRYWNANDDKHPLPPPPSSPSPATRRHPRNDHCSRRRRCSQVTRQSSDAPT